MLETLPSGLSLSLTIRPASELEPKCRDLIAGTWAKSGGRLCVPYSSGKAILDRTRNLSKRSVHVLQNPSSYVALADFPSPSEGDVPVGWIVVAPNLVHFAYVRGPYRGLGVAKLLLKILSSEFACGHSVCPFPALGWIPCTHWTVKFPVEGWFRIQETVLFYCGYEPLTYAEHPNAA